MFDLHVVFLDLETTGGSAEYDRIIEIGLLEVDRGRLIGEWSTLVNPGRHIPQAVQALTGISDDMVAAAPEFGDVCATLAQRLEGKILAAHNARFDYGFLKSEFSRAGLRYSAPVLCTVKLARRLFPQHRRHNLDALLVRHALWCPDRHRALADARVLWQLAQLWGHDPGWDALQGACAELLARPAPPPDLPADIFEELPEGAGVYVLYADDGTALYVGRSSNIRSRVMAHFSVDTRHGEQSSLASQVKRIEHVEAAGELGAFLKESQLMRKLAPCYNRRRHAGSVLWTWRWRPEEPESAPELVCEAGFHPAELDHLYGLFRSRASALAALRGLAQAYNLCQVVLGLEEREGACSAREANCCRGACVGAENLLSHAMRLVQALSRLRVRPWPYPGRIALREHDPNSERTELHVIDRWCYLGTAHSEAELAELACEPQAGIDPDTYKLLARVLNSPRARSDVIPLHAKGAKASN